MYIKHITDFNKWQVSGYNRHSTHDNPHKVIVGLDVEYESNVKTTIEIDGKEQPIDQRDWDDVISIQLAFNYANIQPRKVFIHREHNDRHFTFYQDVMKPLKQYLVDIGMHKVLKNELTADKKPHPFTVELWGFWLGVDISAFEDYLQIMTEDNNTKHPSNLVTINGNTVFTSKPLKLIPRDSQRHRVEMFPEMRLVIRDMKKLAPAKANLASLGDMINSPKLDTEKWDLEAGVSQGYFKSHMTELWKRWPDRFEAYAMNDTVITVLYGSFILQFMNHLNQEGLGKFKPVELKASLSAISANVVANFNQRDADWIVEYIIKDLIKLYNQSECSPSDFNAYLQPLYRKQRKDENFGIDILNVYPILSISSFSKLSHDDVLLVTDWLKQRLNFDLIRKGYYFPNYDKSKHSHHRHLANDLTRKHDLPKADLFQHAIHAFFGGYNIVLTTGILPAGPMKRDYDLKSAYNTNGHLIPDIAPGLGNLRTFEDYNAAQFSEIVDYAETINGPYTVGVGSFSIEYPNDYHGFVITPQRVNDGPRYFKNVKSVTLSYTDAYTAWSCGAKVHTNKLTFPIQATMDPNTMEGVCPDGHVQDILQQRREKYPKENPLNTMFKQTANSIFGANGMGLRKHKSTDFNDAKSYYVPFSAITNALKAIQYTALTRYHITLLQQAIHVIDPNAVLVNNVTDGTLVQSSVPLDTNALTTAMDQLATPRYRAAVHAHFQGIYFEEKDGTNDKVANLRTRFTFSADAELHAMVGIRMSDVSPKAVFDQYIDRHQTSVPTAKHIITSFNDLKNNIKFKHLQGSWNQPTDINLGYDFACWPTNYHLHDDYCWWDTRFYDDLDEFDQLWEFGRQLVKYAPFYTADYAKYFKLTFDAKMQHPLFQCPYYGAFITDDSDYIGNEVYYNFAYYAIEQHLDPNHAYQTIIQVLNNNNWQVMYGKQAKLPKLASFKRFVKNHQNHQAIINYVLLHRVAII